MPMYESMPVKVTLAVEVGGHVLTFEETGKATGWRYHGAILANGNHPSDILESAIRGSVDTAAARASKKANEMIARMYPIVGEAAVASR